MTYSRFTQATFTHTRTLAMRLFLMVLAAAVVHTSTLADPNQNQTISTGGEDNDAGLSPTYISTLMGTDLENSAMFVQKFWSNITNEVPDARALMLFTHHVREVRWSFIKANLWSVLKYCAMKGKSECSIAISRHASKRVQDYLIELGYNVSILGIEYATTSFRVTWDY